MAGSKRTPEEVSEVMRKVHSYNTTPERVLQNTLRERGVGLAFVTLNIGWTPSDPCRPRTLRNTACIASGWS